MIKDIVLEASLPERCAEKYCHQVEVVIFIHSQ